MTNEWRKIIIKEIIGSAIEVHRNLGPGLLESTYELCLCKELELKGLKFEKQKKLKLNYKGIFIEEAYRIDIVVEEEIILELKAVEELKNIHKFQLLTYLKLSNKKLGLLINFNVKLLKEGITRVIN